MSSGVPLLTFIAIMVAFLALTVASAVWFVRSATPRSGAPNARWPA